MRSRKFNLPALAIAFSAVLLAGCATGPGPDATARVSDRDRVQATPLIEVPKAHKGPRYDKPKEAHEYYVRQRVRPGQIIPTERYDIARRAMARMPHFQFGEGGRTRSDGLTPLATITPMSAWSYLGPNNAGGRSRAVAIRPDNANIMLASGVAGGIFRSTNGGTTWAPVNDAMQNMAVVAIEMAPSNPNIVYAGTGEGYFNADAVRGDGVFKSTDGGVTWSKLTSTNRATNSAWSYVYAIRVDPTNASYLWAATWGGVYRSLNGGTSWTRVLNEGYCLDLEFNWSANIAVASCGTLNLPGEVFRSTDRGASFNATPVLAEANQSRTELAVSKSNPAVMYAAAAFYDENSTANYGFRGVWRSSNSGATWTLRASYSDSNPFNVALLGDFESDCTNDPRGQGWYDLEVAVDPANPDVVWVGGIDIYRSNDGGLNFGRAGVWYDDGYNPWGIHADQHRITFHPGYNGTSNQVMFVGNDGGIYKTTNARAAVSTSPTSNCDTTVSPSVVWTELNDGFGVTQFYHGVVHPDAETNELLFMGGTQDNGTWFGDAVPNNWAEIYGGDGGYAAVDTDEGWDRFYTSYQNGNFIRWIWNASQDRYNVITGTNGLNDAGLDFITPLAMDPNDPKVLWTGGSRAWRTSNGMANWVAASVENFGSSTVTAIAVAPGNSNLVLMGTANGEILRNTSASTAGSATAWQTINVSPNGLISEITFDPGTPGRVYATQSQFGLPHVYVSNNGGQSWTAIDKLGQAGGIPDLPAHTIAVDPDDSDRLYVGTDLGLFVSLNAGGTWAVADSPLPNTVVEKLQFHKQGNARKLVAFTHGRGAWMADAGVVYTTRFADVAQSYWAYNQIEQIAAAGITSGCSANPPLYCPTDSVTRGQMAVFLLRSKYGSAHAPPPATGIFQDVPMGLFYTSWVEDLYNEGITSGCSTSPLRYCPESAVTRGQMAIFLLRTKYGPSYTPPSPTGLFSDVPLNQYYAAWVEQLYNEGVTSGCGTNPLRFCPEEPVLRDQMAVFLVRTFDP